MGRNRPHQMRVRNHDDPGHLHELTFSCYRRLPLLTNDEWRAELPRVPPMILRSELSHWRRLVRRIVGVAQRQEN